ncbi:PAS domain S-box protein [Halorussus salilacus]|uniref:PAS domain S-box protein n=1 Tax=Halorussus salilacus TaxID=2953750 RepID=UPI00209EDA23|nr:PAS domain S-box protein [Halorussus salilacus]USZ68789.1 PAS domain S-box protein [Halorussus salilacus]
MTDAVSVVYLAPDRATAESVESLLEDERPGISLSAVTSVERVERALDALDGDPPGRVVVDAEVVGRSDGDLVAELRDANPDVPVETVESDASGGERERALAAGIAAAATPANGDGFVEDAHFRALAEAVSDAILVIDTDSVVRFANPAVEGVFGYAPDELVGESLTELMPEEYREPHREGIERYLREDERRLDWESLEFPGEHRDGHEIPLGLSFSEFVREGELLFTGIVRDITQRRRREDELRDRVDQQRAVAEFSQRALEDRPLDELFEEAVELVAETLDHEYTKVLELTPDRDDLLLRSGVGWDEGVVGSATVPSDEGSQAGYTLLSEEPVVVEDLDAEDRFSGPDLLTSHGVKSGVSTVIGTPGDPWGILGTHDTDRRTYADHDVQFVRSLASILATAVQRRERERDLKRYGAMVEAVGDGVYALDSESRFLAVNDAYVSLTGYSREELVGERASTVVPESAREAVEPTQSALDPETVTTTETATTETAIRTADGEEVPVEARVSALPLGDGRWGQVGVVRDISDRRRREQKLTSLHEMMGALADAEASDDIASLAVDAAVETLGFENAAVALYDDDEGRLTPAARRWREDEPIDEALLGTRSDDLLWRTFVDGETRVVRDLPAELDAEVSMGAALAVPLGKHGAFLAADPEPGSFEETDVSLADILCANVESALDRAGREETLRDQRNALREKNRELERVNRLNRVIREMTRVLTSASTDEEVMQAVCDRLAATGPYRFAWFGEPDPATGEVEPRAWAGVEEGYLDEISVTADESPTGRGPAGRALRTGEPKAQADLLGDPPFEPWREQALKRGYRSSVSVPVTYGNTTHGVLNIYAGEPGVFDETERSVLAELGETIGYALNAIERKEALVSERSVDLDFRVRDEDDPILSFVAETGARLDFENAVQRSDGLLHIFVTLSDVSPDSVASAADDISRIAEARLVADRGDETLYEVALGGESILAVLVDHGAIPRSMTMAGTEARFVVRVPQSADVRTIVGLFEDIYDEVELVARRERDEPVMTRHEFERELEDRLTDRQREVLELAYFSGFFEWPRESTAEEIAEALDVSQPTVSRHIRGAERTLFSLIFEE